MRISKLAGMAAAQASELECVMVELSDKLCEYEEKMIEQEERTRKAEAALQNLTGYIATFREREQQVENAEEKIKAALAAKEKAEEALAVMTTDRDKYRQWWETAKGQAETATKKTNPKKDKNGQNQSNAAVVSQYSTVQNLIDKAVMKKSEELEKQHKQKMDTLNAKIDNLTTANESLEAENEELRRRLRDTNQAFDDSPCPPNDDESGGIVQA